ncbi:MAG: ComEC/Rec2 family competence protein [Proteobacteria bacterium]|nr:ComEC/Rec2 family competence protein [Pseudomonadota bacterium]
MTDLLEPTDRQPLASDGRLLRWRRHVFGRPLLVLVVAYGLGLVSAPVIDLLPWIGAALSGLLALAAGGLFWRRAPGWLAAGAGAIAFLGLILGLPPSAARLPADHVLRLADGRTRINLVGLVDRTPQPGLRSSVLFLRTMSANGRGARGRIRLTMGRLSPRVAPGDLVALTTRLKPIHFFANPGGFDYAAYMARRGVFVRGFIKTDADLRIIGRGRGGPWLRVLAWCHRLRTAAAAAVTGNLPPPDGQYRTAMSRAVRRMVGAPGHGAPWRYPARVWRKWRAEIDRPGSTRLVSTRASLYLALLLGQRRLLSRDEYDRFAQTGVAHLLAISGLHLGLVTGAVFFVFFLILRQIPGVTRSHSAPTLALALALPVAAAYALLSGGSIPTVRALIMVSALVAAWVFGRGRDLFSALALAALVILILQPGAVYEASFQLSFCAVAGIIAVYRPLYGLAFPRRPGRHRPPSFWARIGRVGWGWVAVSLAASLATLPLIAWHFHRLSFISLPANLIVTPLVAFIALPVGLLALAILPLSSTLGGWLLQLGGGFLGAAIDINSRLAEVPLAWTWIIKPTAVEMILFWAGVWCLVFIRYRKWARVVIVAVLALAAADAAWWLIAPRFDRRLQVHVLDVGQGSAAALRLPDGRWVIIDGGGVGWWDFDTGQNLVAPFLWKKRVARVAVVINTHPQVDHFGGLTFVVRHFRPRQVWINGQHPPNPGWQNF